MKFDIVFDEPAWPELANAGCQCGQMKAGTMLPGGMTSGRASVAFRVWMDDGSDAVVQCSLDILETFIRACRDRERYLVTTSGQGMD